MKRPNHKPGAERQAFKPDVIEKYSVTAPSTLLEYLLQVMPQRKRTNVKELLKHNQVAVNGMPVTQFDAPLAEGDEVKVNLTREFKVFYHRRLKIVYEDDDIIVVNKGYGLLSMGNDKVKDGTAYSILRDYVKWGDPRNKIFIVHRLDRDTSGLMVFAKNEEAKEKLQHNWNNMVLERKYLAVVEGTPEPPQGTVKSYLTENSQFEVYSTNDPTQGKLAVTRYSTLKSRGKYALLEVELDTGRKNQIRVHMKDLGHPIAGDRKYGADSSPIHRLALHARTLRFVHPISRKEMSFTTPIPASFASMVK
ncbi:MAG: RluA family pseudouridine synthase [Bacteroides sp.]|nr:RluA family pseudouridine synthase [Barnesiella sp.]MBD5323498.1 RluA family pseudouridine synthase [Bacteroides sp.]MBD5330968.1 RluA family pseudouridine synthase [Bacteroides sp.]MBD5375187.1 RluA family pseudouridine synthase [Bacteroides sp.]